jgi:hypothetical protein
MILFGCLLAFSIALAPRVILVLAWIFSARWPLVWQGEWILPLLGIVFLPYTTIMYLLTWTLTGGIEGWDWMWILIGLFLDFMKWSQLFANRKEAAKQASSVYASGASGSGTAATATAAPAAAAPAAPAASAAPAAPAAAVAPTEPAPPAEPAEPPAPEAAPAADSGGFAELDKLHDSGALTDEEYEAAKAKLQG